MGRGCRKGPVPLADSGCWASWADVSCGDGPEETVVLPCCGWWWWFTAVWFEGSIFSDEDGVRFPGEEEVPAGAAAVAVAI